LAGVWVHKLKKRLRIERGLAGREKSTKGNWSHQIPFPAFNFGSVPVRDSLPPDLARCELTGFLGLSFGDEDLKFFVRVRVRVRRVEMLKVFSLELKA